MTDVFHITHIRNIESILSEKGLCCDNERNARDLKCTGIAHQHIKDRRAKKIVPVCKGGTLADYVPFYFAPRSPMLYAIHTGSVEGYSQGQSEVLHFRLSVEEMVKAGLDCAFTDGHADMVYTTFYEDLSDLPKVDWEIMTVQYWHDTADDGDRKRRRQAEFLVHAFVPWKFVREIGVINSAMVTKVEEAIAPAKHRPEVRIRRPWYY